MTKSRTKDTQISMTVSCRNLTEKCFFCILFYFFAIKWMYISEKVETNIYRSIGIPPRSDTTTFCNGTNRHENWTRDTHTLLWPLIISVYNVYGFIIKIWIWMIDGKVTNNNIKPTLYIVVIYMNISKNQQQRDFWNIYKN